MNLQDLIVTPILLILVYLLAMIIRNRITDGVNRKYFMPGLTLKIIGAISLGLIYQFYYKGGDTLNYFDRGSKYIWEAFRDSPLKGLQLMFANGEYNPETFQYASEIIYYNDLPSYFVVRVASFFDLLTFHTYSATAVLFAVFSFSGLWAMYTVFYRMLPKMHLQLAIAIFFIPSVFFWGSGILKDTITLGALGWGIYAFAEIFMFKRNFLLGSVILLLSFFMIYEIKIYILLCLVPALMIWFYLSTLGKIKNLVLKSMILPFTIVLLFIGGYYSVKLIGQENHRYNLERLSYTAESTARWLSYVSEREEGSGYTLGDFDYSPAGIMRKTPAAIWVTLFRPYLWEAKNLVMFLSAIESFLLFIFTLFAVGRVITKRKINELISNPIVVFCLVFSITFAFAIGLSTYNFGTLVRYKIPMLPLYMIAMFMLLSYSKRPRKFVAFTSKE
ncbi:MAG: hypothetical protein PVH48_02040 [Cyclobacteriaceae bacterium]|jgi:hypothetical protein